MSATSYVQGPAGHIEVRLLRPVQPDTRLALVCHPHPLFGGTMDNKVVSTLQRVFRDQGMAVALFNFRGVGGSAGVHDHAVGEIEDCLAVLAWAAAETGAQHIYLAGFSFGSYVAAAASSRVPAHLQVRQLLLVAPPVHHYPFADLPLPAATCVLIGEEDEVVPPEDVYAWAAQRHLPLRRLPACSHFFHGHLPELRQLLLDELA